MLIPIAFFILQVFVPRLKSFLLNPDPSNSGPDGQNPGPTAASRQAGGDVSPTPGGSRGYSKGAAGAGGSSGRPPMGGGGGSGMHQRDNAAMLLASRSPIFAALQHHAAQQQQQQQLGVAGMVGGVGSAAAGGRRGDVLTSVSAGGNVYRTLSLDNGSTLSSLGSFGGSLGSGSITHMGGGALGMAGEVGANLGGTGGGAVSLPAITGHSHGQEYVVLGSSGLSGVVPAAGGAGGNAPHASNQQHRAVGAQGQGGGGKTPVQAAGGKAYVPSRLGRPSPLPGPERIGVGGYSSGGVGGERHSLAAGQHHLQQQQMGVGVGAMYGGGAMHQLIDSRGRNGLAGGQTGQADARGDGGMDQGRGEAAAAVAVGGGDGRAHESSSSTQKTGLTAQRRGSNSSGVSSGGDTGPGGGEGMGGYKQMAGGTGMGGTAPSGLESLLRALDTAGDMDQSGPTTGGLGQRGAAAGVSS